MRTTNRTAHTSRRRVSGAGAGQIRFGRSLIQAVLILCAAGCASAAPILYTIDFTLSGGVLPTSGSFIYDSDPAAPTPGFSNFNVTWDGHTYNLNDPTLTSPSASANSPLIGPVPGPCQTTADAAGTFNMLSDPSACSGSRPGSSATWTAWIRTSTGQFGFDFYADSPPGDGDYTFFGIFADGAGGTTLFSTGAWTIQAQATVPEPAPWCLLLAPLAIFAAAAFVQRKTPVQV